jgi:hypothetical protein
MTLSQEVYEAGKEIASATGASLPSILNGVLERYVHWPIKVSSGRLLDRNKSRSDDFVSVVYAVPEAGTRSEPEDIPADNAAAVIDACESLDLEKFRASYARIAHVKRLKKSPAPVVDGVPVQTTTLGLIFALRSTIPLDQIAEELRHLNAQTPSAEWPDMVVVETTGTVNYAVQFPGESLAGDFLPPAAKPACDTYNPPIYIVIVLRPTGPYTFNRMLGFLIGQLFFFSPGIRLPDGQQLMEGVSNQAITVSAFQYNLSGDLVPVPREFYNDRYLPPLPVRIEHRSGELLCTLQFLPWQDGGAILSRGKLPLDGIMPFLIGVETRRAQRLKRDDHEIILCIANHAETF